MHTLTANAATAIATYGVILHTGAAARREFCIAVVGEIIETGAKADDVFAAAKIAADYDGMEDAERALFRKQVQYCRAIADGWSKLTTAQRRAFVGGSLPASSAVKLLKPKAATAPETETGSEPETGSETGSETVKVSQEPESVASAMERIADYLETANPADFSKAEAQAYSAMRRAIENFTARASQQVKLAKAA